MKLTTILLLAVGLVGLSAIAVRLYPVRAEEHHVDPLTVDPPNSPNFVLMRGADAVRHPADLAASVEALDAAIAALGGAPLAGALSDGHASFVFRSRIMGFPDVLSIRLLQADADPGAPMATEIAIFSRSLFGYGDLGVNRARVERLLTALTP
ncbi:MAG: DUF1499 domain-containing protein [Pseudomonadota bacterium]